MTKKPLEAYYTPAWATHVLLDYATELTKDQFIFEPCTGEDAIYNVLYDRGYTKVYTNDINHGITAHFNVNYLTNDFKRYRFDWIVTNPPFSIAMPLLKKALTEAHHVALLLRLSFLEPTLHRGEWLETHVPYRVIIMPRISFTGDGHTDRVTTAWMCWSDIEDNTKDPYCSLSILPRR